MSSPNWTPEQTAAIDLKGQILVAAAAGSGKTAVLVQRLIRRITGAEEKTDVNRFLVVTFTKAAAAEMRERIGKALDDALFTATDPLEVEHLLRQRALLYRAQITTLHSFCMELLRQYFYQIELDPAFRVADDTETDLLRQDIIEDLFEAYYAQENRSFQNLVDAFGTDRDDQPLMEAILRLHEFAMSQIHPEEWLKELPTAYQWSNSDELLQSPWGKVVQRRVLDQVEDGLALLERAHQIAVMPGGPLQYAPVLQDDLARLRLLQQSFDRESWSRVEEAFKVASVFPTLPRGGKKSQGQALVDEDEQKRLREESKKARDEAKKKLEDIKAAVFSIPLGEQLPFLAKMSQLVQTLAQVTLKFIEEYQKAKRQRNIVDFGDLEHFALRLLTEANQPSVIAKKLQEYYAEVLVDEYQDINPVQERILQLVSRQNGPDANLFMVGDVKQSIYRFRMADPRLFLKKYGDFPHYKVGEEAAHQELVIDLNQNFRSRAEVIHGINFLFYQLMTEGAGEVAYNEQAALRPGAKFVTNPDLKTAEGPIEVHLFDPKDIAIAISRENQPEESVPAEPINLESKEDEGLEDVETARIEASLVATRIQAMVNNCEFQIHDKELGDFRPVQYSDIVILMRSLSAVAPIYIEELQKAGVPVYGETNSGYFGTNEVDTILSLLKAIDNPRVDIPLVSVLRSPLVGMNGTELGKLRSLIPNGDFYETIALTYWAGNEAKSDNIIDSEVQKILERHQEYLPQLKIKAKEILKEAPDLKDKVNYFFSKLQDWRQLARRSSLGDLIWHLYEETGYLAYVGTLPSGSQRQANLRILYDRACRYEETNYRGLFRFLRFLEKFQSQGKDLGNASTVGEKENVVRLITVHSSKGLEFPVVYVVGLGKKFNTRSLSSKLLLHSQLGVGIPLIDIENQVRYPSLIQYAVKERMRQESLAEELRILYVALTRAKERLLLFGHLDKSEETLANWQSLARNCSTIAYPDGQLHNAKTFLDWIGPALMRHPDQLFAGYPQIELSLPDSTSKWKCIIHGGISNFEGLLPTEEVDLKTEDAAQKVESLPEIGKDQVICADQVNRGDGDEETTESPRARLKEEVYRRLNWRYPYADSVNKPAKTSVSELKRRLPWYTDTSEGTGNSSSASNFPRPKFMQGPKEFSAVEKGTALHTVIQHLPIKTWSNSWEGFTLEEKDGCLADLLQSLLESEIISEEQKKVVSITSLRKLLDSLTGRRLFEAEELRREVPFTLSLSLKNQKEPVLVQGIIDAVVLSPLAQKADIIDFKTDNLGLDFQPEVTLAKRYALQLGLYARAVERLLKIPVQNHLIYSTSLNREFEIPSEVIQAALDSL